MASKFPQARSSGPRTPPRGPAESLRPPRYRLLSAAARLPQREPDLPTVSFERDCPACGRLVFFTQVTLLDGPEYLVETHDCV